MNWVSQISYASTFVTKLRPCSVKWLGKDAISALSVDGKGTKAELLGKVAQWVTARGRNVTHPGDDKTM